MASLYCNNKVRDSCFSNGRSCSKAQACLEKILHTISTIPPPSENNPNPFKKIDLNLRLGSFADDDDDGNEEKSESLTENSFVGKNPDEEEEDEEEEIQERTAATGTDVSSDVTEIQKSEELKSGGTDGVEVKTTAAAFNDALDLLIEAAEMISERDYCCVNEKGKEVEEVETRNKIKDTSLEEEGFEELEDISPVVRSKRGRSLVLPHRFRDSVLEPWKKRPQIQSQRSTTAVVSKKKRRSW